MKRGNLLHVDALEHFIVGPDGRFTSLARGRHMRRRPAGPVPWLRVGGGSADASATNPPAPSKPLSLHVFFCARQLCFWLQDALGVIPGDFVSGHAPLCGILKREKCALLQGANSQDAWARTPAHVKIVPLALQQECV